MLQALAHGDGFFNAFDNGGAVVCGGEAEVCAQIASVGDDLYAIAYVSPGVLSKSVASVFTGGEVVGFVGGDTGSDVSEVVVRGVEGFGEGL